MNKKVFKISLLFFSTIAILLVADKLIKYFNETEIFHYDINGNEIYYKTGNYIKYTEYNEDNQPLEIKEKYNKDKYDYTYYEYDGGLLKKIIHKMDPSSDKEDFEISYEYDVRGNKLKEINSKDGTISYEYDEHNNLIKEIHSSKGTTLYFYDENGWKIKEVSPDDKITEYKHDEKGNLIEVKCSDGSSYTTEYDDKDRVIKRIFVNDEFWGNLVHTFEFKDDDPEINTMIYSFGDNITGYKKKDKYDEIFESGEIVNGKEKAIKRNYIKYEFWDNGKVKTKKIYNINKLF